MLAITGGAVAEEREGLVVRLVFGFDTRCTGAVGTRIGLGGCRIRLEGERTSWLSLCEPEGRNSGDCF